MTVRTAKITENEHQGSLIYIVSLYEDDVLVDFRPLVGKSIHYANSLVENWENGILEI